MVASFFAQLKSQPVASLEEYTRWFVGWNRGSSRR